MIDEILRRFDVADDAAIDLRVGPALRAPTDTLANVPQPLEKTATIGSNAASKILAISAPSWKIRGAS